MGKINSNELYSPFSSMMFDYNHCFLCGVELTDENKTVEHIFPKWLQQEHNLWSQKLTLINGSTIPYRNLTIPCCKTCNGAHLSEIEKKIKEAVSAGYENFLKLDRKIVFLWMTKIFYGILFKELSLVADRSKPDRGNLMTPKSLERFKMVHEFLQSVRMNVSFEAEVFSLFVFNVHRDTRNDSKYDFFISDNIVTTQIAIQVGEIGIVCCIGEMGIIKKSLNNILEPFYKMKIHKIQFLEIIGRVFHKRSTLIEAPTYIFINSKEENKILPIGSIFTADLFDEFKQIDIAKFIYSQLRYYGYHLDYIYDKRNDAVITYLTNTKGYIHIMNEYGEVVEEPRIKHSGFFDDILPENVLNDFIENIDFKSDN